MQTPRFPGERRNMNLTRVAIGCVLVTSVMARASETEREVDEAVRAGLALAEKAAANYPNHRECFSCHHQTLPMLAMVAAPGAGDGKALLKQQGEFTRDSFADKLDALKAGKGIGGGAMTVSYALWAL